MRTFEIIILSPKHLRVEAERKIALSFVEVLKNKWPHLPERIEEIIAVSKFPLDFLREVGYIEWKDWEYDITCISRQYPNVTFCIESWEEYYDNALRLFIKDGISDITHRISFWEEDPEWINE